MDKSKLASSKDLSSAEKKTVKSGQVNLTRPETIGLLELNLRRKAWYLPLRIADPFARMKGLKARPPSKRVAPKHGLQAATQAHEEFMRELVRNGDADQSVTKPVAKPLAKSPGRTKTKSSSRRKTPKAKAKIETRSALSGARSPNVGQKLHAVSAPLEVGLDASAEWRSSVYRKLRPKAEESEVDFKWLEAIARTEGWHVRPSEVELKDALGQGSCGKLDFKLLDR